MNAPLKLLTAGIVFTAAQLSGVALAQPATPAAAASMPAASAAITEQPQADFNGAIAAYAKKDYKLAAAEIRKATGYLRSTARRATGDARAALDGSVVNLDKLSAAVEQGAVKDEKDLQQSFGKADHALALAHRTDAAESWARKQYDQAGGELKAAANDLETAAGWTGNAARAGFAGVVTDTKLLGNKLATGAHWTRDEVSHGFSALGNALDQLGHNIGAKDKAAPVG